LKEPDVLSPDVGHTAIIISRKEVTSDDALLPVGAFVAGLGITGNTVTNISLPFECMINKNAWDGYPLYNT
jgi:hypothetical protein